MQSPTYFSPFRASGVGCIHLNNVGLFTQGISLVTRTTWALLLALTLATVLLVPRDLDYTFPAESTARVIITETGVSPEELLSLAERHGVEVVQLRMTTDAMGQTGEPLATNVIEVLGHDPDDYIRPPLTPVFSEAPIVYAGSPSQDPALGAWNVIGGEERVRHFLDAARAQWSDAIWKSDALVPGTATQAMRQSALGRALLLALLTHTVVTASAVLARPAPFRHSLLSGRSRARLLIRLLRLGLVSVSIWILAPLGALGLIMAYDVHAGALLSVHRLMAELIVVAALAALTTTVIGTTLGWAVLAHTGRGRAVGSSVLAPRVRMVPGALVCGAALAMTWSFASSSDAVVTDILQDQALRHQAQAQDSLPASYSLSIRTASESAYDSLMPRIDSFIKDEEATGSLVLAWAVPDDTTPDAGGPPTLYLNNTAASHYGLENVGPTEVALYRRQGGAEDDAALTARLSRDAALEARLTLLEESPKVKELVCEGMAVVDPPKEEIPEEYKALVEEYAPSDEPPSDIETLTDIDGLSIEDYEFINSSNEPVGDGEWDVKYDAASDVLYDEDEQDISAEKPALRAFLAQWFQGDSEARYAEIGENGQGTPVRVMIVPDEYGEAWYD